MNKIRIFITVAVLVLFTIPFNSNASTRLKPTEPNTEAASIRAETLVKRLEEIKGMDKSTLSRGEKKELNKEVRSIRKELKSSGGIYLSVGAVIIIILLLILLV
jgi:hypothetical protein